MVALRSWLLSFLLATAFALGVVAVVTADPATMLDEEDQHSEQTELQDADATSALPRGESPPHPDDAARSDALAAGFLERWVTTRDSVAAASAGAFVAARAIMVIGGRPPI